MYTVCCQRSLWATLGSLLLRNTRAFHRDVWTSDSRFSLGSLLRGYGSCLIWRGNLTKAVQHRRKKWDITYYIYTWGLQSLYWLWQLAAKLPNEIPPKERLCIYTDDTFHFSKLMRRAALQCNYSLKQKTCQWRLLCAVVVCRKCVLTHLTLHHSLGILNPLPPPQKRKHCSYFVLCKLTEKFDSTASVISLIWKHLKRADVFLVRPYCVLHSASQLSQPRSARLPARIDAYLPKTKGGGTWKWCHPLEVHLRPSFRQNHQRQVRPETPGTLKILRSSTKASLRSVELLSSNWKMPLCGTHCQSECARAVMSIVITSLNSWRLIQLANTFSHLLRSKLLRAAFRLFGLRWRQSSRRSNKATICPRLISFARLHAPQIRTLQPSFWQLVPQVAFTLSCV